MLASLVRQHRRERGFTQEQLAEEAGLSVRSIQDLERGLSVPQRDTVERLVRALGLQGEQRVAFEVAARARPRRRSQAPISAPGGTARRVPTPPVLQRYLTSFIGRDREVGEVKRLLESTRLLTLTGPGGIGKTRLAYEIADQLRQRYADGIFVIELAPLMDPLLLAQTVASAIGIHERPPSPITETLIDTLRTVDALLVLDNCEHLVQACASHVDMLLKNTSSVRVLATSREPLGIGGELVSRVPTLSLPDPTPRREAMRVVTESEAGRLFVQRARAAVPDFDITEDNARAIARICRRLDGIALALELAAAWIPVLSVAQIVERLEDALQLLVLGDRAAPPRHQTLRATLDWSYNLLSQAERTLFDRVSVFSGGWTLSAAEVVCADESLERKSILDALAQLVRKSLVLAEPGASGSMRYRLLEPVRQYASEHLVESMDAQSVKRRHAAYYVEIAELAEMELRGADREIWLERLDAEHDNMRVALGWAERGGDSTIALRLAGALSRFWAIRGHLHEGLGWLGAVQDLEAGASRARAKVLSGAGWLALLQGNQTRARLDLEASLALVRSLHDTSGIAETLKNLGRVALEEDDLKFARACLTESLNLSRAMGYRWTIAFDLTGLAQITFLEGDTRRARMLFEQGLAAYRLLDSPRHVAVTLSNLAAATLEDGDDVGAQALYSEALAIVRETGDRPGLIHVLEGYAGLARGRGDVDLAQRLLDAANGLRAASAYPAAVSDHAWPDAPLAMVPTDVDAHEYGDALPLPFERALAIADEAAEQTQSMS